MPCVRRFMKHPTHDPYIHATTELDGDILRKRSPDSCQGDGYVSTRRLLKVANPSRRPQRMKELQIQETRCFPVDIVHACPSNGQIKRDPHTYLPRLV